MSDRNLVITFSIDVRPALHSIRVARERLQRALTPGWRWHDPDTGRFVKHG